MPDSIQDRLFRGRRSRVQIKYSVHIGDAEVQKELPFVLGVMADLSGHRGDEDPLPDLSERKFINVDRDNFNEFLARQRPRLQINVDDKITGKEDQQLGVDLEFKSMKDFEPDQIVRAVPALQSLLEVRERLESLKRRAGSSKELKGLLEKVIANQDDRQALADILGVGGGSEGAEAAGESAPETPKPEGEA